MSLLASLFLKMYSFKINVLNYFVSIF